MNSFSVLNELIKGGFGLCFFIFMSFCKNILCLTVDGYENVLDTNSQTVTNSNKNNADALHFISD